MSRESKLAQNTLILSVGTFLPRVASFITLPILTGYLTQEEYGTYDLVTVLVSLLLPAATLQIQTAAFRFLIDVKNDNSEIKSIVTNIYAFIIPTSIIALLILFFCFSGLSVGIRLWICAYFLADIFLNSARQITRGLSKNWPYSLSAIISASGELIFVVIFVWILRIGLLGSVIALCVATTFSLIYLVLRTKLYQYLNVHLLSWKKIKEMLAYSWPMVPNSMSMWVMRMSDRLVVTFFMGVAANAVYSVANKIPQILNLAQNAFTMAWQENASIVSKDEDAPAYYSSMFRVMYNLMAGFMGLLVAATPLLFIIFIQGDYDEAYYQMPILFLGMFFYSMSTYLGGIYVAYKATRSVGITTIIAAACNLVIDICLINFIGLYAASGSTLISYLLLLIFRMVNVRKLVDLKYYYGQMALGLCVMILECCLCFMRNTYLNWLNVAIGIAFFYVMNRALIKSAINTGIKYIFKRNNNNKM